MAKARVKPIHLIQIRWSHNCCAVCDRYIETEPIEANIIKKFSKRDSSKGTFDPTKVTCKRCLKSEDYKTAMDKINYPLFFLKDGIV